MIDKALIKERFSKAANSYENEATVQKGIAKKMNDILCHSISSPPSTILEIGAGTGFLSRHLLKTFTHTEITINDLCEDMEAHFTDISDKKGIKFLWGDAEKLLLPKNQNLVVSCSTLQWFEDLESFFKRCNTILSSKGYLAFSTFGCDNLKEISYITGTTLNYHSINYLTQLLSNDFNIIYSNEEHVKIEFKNPIDTLYHLKSTGVSGLKRVRFTKDKLKDFSLQYIKKFGNNGNVSLTYHPIYIVAQKKQ